VAASDAGDSVGPLPEDVDVAVVRAGLLNQVEQDPIRSGRRRAGPRPAHAVGVVVQVAERRSLGADEPAAEDVVLVAADPCAFAMVRIAESFLWTDLITGGAPDLTKAREVAKVLLT
jgi:Tetracyclin repressor-like, C-terminal domain